MQTDQIEGDWTQLEGSVRKQWADLTDDDLHSVQGSWQKLEGVIRTRYGRATEAVGKEMRDFRREHESLAPGHHLTS